MLPPKPSLVSPLLPAGRERQHLLLAPEPPAAAEGVLTAPKF